MRRAHCTICRTIALTLILSGGACRQRSPERQPEQKLSREQILQKIAQLEWRRSDPDQALERWTTYEDAHVRRRALLALGRGGFFEAVDVVRKALDDTDLSVRRNAAFALRLLALDSPLADLVRLRQAVRKHLMAAKQAAYRDALATTLSWVGESSDLKRIEDAIRDGSTAAFAAWGTLNARLKAQGVEFSKRLDPDRVSSHIQALEDASADRRQIAAWALSQLGPHQLETSRVARRLARGARLSSDPIVRMWLVRALGPARAGWHVRWAMRRLRDVDVRVQIEAARALAAGSKSAAVVLARAMDRMWREVSSSAADLVGSPIEPILSGLSGLEPRANVPTVQQYAGRVMHAADASASTVSYTPEEQLSIDLVHCAAARVWDLGENITAQTPTCGTAHASQLDSAWRRMQVVDVVQHMNRDDSWKLMMLRRYLSDSSPEVRASALTALAGIESTIAESTIRRALSDKQVAIFRAAASVVAKHAALANNSQIVTMLVNRLDVMHPLAEPEALCAVADALGASKTPVSRAALRSLLKTPAWAVRRCAQRAWRQSTKKAAPRAAHTSRGTPEAYPHGGKNAEKRPLLEITTAKGSIRVVLFPEIAPAAVQRIVRLASEGAFKPSRVARLYYNDSVIIDVPHNRRLMAQTRYRLPCELSDLPFERGSVGLVTSGRDTADYRLFITLQRDPLRDGRYTLIGRIIDGWEVLHQLLPHDVIADISSYEPEKDAGYTTESSN